MKKVLLGLMIAGSPFLVSADESVGAVDQATLLLSTAERDSFRLLPQIDADSTDEACQTALNLQITVEALESEPINEAAMEVNPWVLRNVFSGKEDINTIVELCESGLAEDEIERAKKSAQRIFTNMTLESVQ